MEQKKYTDVIRLGHQTTEDIFNEGNFIIIQEKLDGANASFRYDEETNNIRAFSRNMELHEEENLHGFFQWTQQLAKEEIVAGMVYFGEWLNPHKIKYPQYEKQFFLFDMYDTVACEYVDFAIVERKAQRLGLHLVPVFYQGEYQGEEHLKSFVGKTALGGRLRDEEIGEGIVVKNADYRDRFGRQLFVKIVTDVFSEVKRLKPPKDPNQPKSGEVLFVEQYVTRARVEKFLYKLIDEGVLEETFGVKDMGAILKNLNLRIQEDLFKEEADSLPDGYDEKELRKAISKVIPLFVKELFSEKAPGNP
ncbi:RNA ligase family protein [Brevibacillus sp. RS1.1]|uniref:RNA ligase family protein n=1 Tax=Brevibacillus sp. RS1.1 TaxID=2738982 RepID=UPI00156A7F67|nr:RNA ligase family protein [Brevibacillus sp. RS1.1]NRR00995.1 RNA ligase family protein [Brevibacillus sp. RS1.1]